MSQNRGALPVKKKITRAQRRKSKSELLSLQGSTKKSPTERELARRTRARVLAKSKKQIQSGASTFKYTAISPLGQRVTSTMISPDRSTVSRALVGDGWTPLSIEEQKSQGLNLDLNALFGSGIKFKRQELADFARALQQLIRAGLPQARAMASLGEEQRPARAKLCSQVAEKLTSGIALSKALAEFPTVFDEVFISYVAAGEETGTLSESLDRLAGALERKATLHTKIKAVTAYPKMVSSAVAVIVVGILVFLVPQFTKIYAGFHAQLPAPTLALIHLSHLMNPITTIHGIPFISFQSPITLGFIGICGFKYWIKVNVDNLELGAKLDKIRYRMPIFGKLNRKIDLYQWASNLSGALAAGLQQTPAINLAARASGSPWHRLVAVQLGEDVRTGRKLSEALSDHTDLYPPNVRAMVSTGEAAGELPAMLENVAKTINTEIDGVIAGLSAKIEVGLLLVLGTVVGSILAVLYLPILNLSSVAGNSLQGTDPTTATVAKAG